MFNKAAEVRHKDESQWTQADYRTMCSFKKQKDDPALAKSLAELKKQWDERKNRQSPAKPIRPMPALAGNDNDDVMPTVSEDSGDGEEEVS